MTAYQVGMRVTEAEPPGRHGSIIAVNGRGPYSRIVVHLDGRGLVTLYPAQIRPGGLGTRRACPARYQKAKEDAPVKVPPRPFTALGASRANMLVIGAGYAVYALSLLLQGARWSRTPAYHNLLAVMPAPGWGTCFAVVSAALLAAVGRQQDRALSVAALTAAGVITAAWTLAFLVRWATSDSTTPETWVSWAVNAYLLARSAVLLDYREVLIPGRRGNGDGADG